MKLSEGRLLFATILYADVFDWPLTRDELILWGIQTQSKTFRIPSTIAVRRSPYGMFYLLAHRNNFVDARQTKEVNANQKWKIARRVATFMQIIPTLKLVGVTGGLSRNNVKEEDDIDLFCITKSGTVWISRLLAILLVELLGIRRRPEDTDVADKICLNMFMSEDALSVAMKERDLFAAYEVLQMTPLWERGGAYKKFLMANSWAAKFLLNAWKKKYLVSSIKYQGKTQNGFISLILNTFTLILTLFEPLARIIQLWYMRHRRTTEVIAPGVLRFHPRDARDWIKRAFEQRLSRYNLPLDKIFYAR